VVRDPLVRDAINKEHLNPRYLTDYVLPDTLTAASDAGEALKGCTCLVAAVPVQVTRKVLSALKHHVPLNIPIVAVSKGIEQGTIKLMKDLIPEALERNEDENPVVFVSGPSFAQEVMDKCPTSVVAASKNMDAAAKVQSIFTSNYFRVSTTDDITAVEVAGALKNVLAIAAGICDGLGLGVNAMSAVVTQGTAEIRWLATAMGGRPETLSGLSGMGDILLTAFGSKSRNRTLGVRLGKGETVEQILASGEGVCEGYYTAGMAIEMAANYKVLMPVLTAVARILDGRVSPREAVYQIMSLPPIQGSA